jgi:hypothetical protein
MLSKLVSAGPSRAPALRLLAEHTRADALLSENATRRENFEIKVQDPEPGREVPAARNAHRNETASPLLVKRSAAAREQARTSHKRRTGT